MRGAYVAKPDADTSPYAPEGWRIDWPFPGPPYPPGWEPEDPTPDDDSDDYDEEEEEAPDYSLTASGPDEISVSDPSAEIVAYLLNGAVATEEPLGYQGKCSEAKYLTVSATVDGEERTVNGESSVDIAYESVGDYWGFTETIEFGLDEINDQGETLIVSVTTSPYMPTPYEDKAELISETTTVLIPITMLVRIEIECEVIGDEGVIYDNPLGRGYFFIGDLYLTRKIGPWETEYSSYAIREFSGNCFEGAPYGLSWNYFTDTHVNVSEITPTASGITLTMTVEDAEADTYWVDIRQQFAMPDEGPDNYSFDMNVTIRTYVGGELYATQTFSRTNEVGSYTFTTVFATIDGRTGEITLLDPPVTTFI